MCVMQDYGVSHKGLSSWKDGEFIFSNLHFSMVLLRGGGLVCNETWTISGWTKVMELILFSWIIERLLIPRTMQSLLRN